MAELQGQVCFPVSSMKFDSGTAIEADCDTPTIIAANL
jgi:hypothetical protein